MTAHEQEFLNEIKKHISTPTRPTWSVKKIVGVILGVLAGISSVGGIGGYAATRAIETRQSTVNANQNQAMTSRSLAQDFVRQGDFNKGQQEQDARVASQLEDLSGTIDKIDLRQQDSLKLLYEIKGALKTKENP